MQPDPCEILRGRVGDGLIGSTEENGGLYLRIRPQSILICTSILQSDRSLAFSSLVDCFASSEGGGISIYYQLVSYLLGERLFIVTEIPKGESAQSLTVVFWNVDWYEREIFETFGVSFIDHPNMRPIFQE
ncbi:MAG: NADH-quinone oxidoreductase subunit C [Holosporales bacterium]|nr:NADH-quinone oxidoreductase subunit C [Holosporales bacterium]